MSEGYYKMERGWMEHAFFGEAEYSEREAWEWMISEACYAERIFNINGTPTKLVRGQFSHSLRFIGEKLRWNKDKVARFIERLKKWNMIETANETGQNIITICNYAKYQDSATANETGKNKKPRQQRDKEEGKNKEEEKKIVFNGKVIRLNAQDWDKLRAKSGLSQPAFETWVCGKDDYYSTLAEHERAEWWMRLNGAIKGMKR